MTGALRCALAVVLTLCLAATASAQAAFSPPPGRNPQGAAWASGATCPPVDAPLGVAGSLYTCTSGVGYVWSGVVWVALGTSTLPVGSITGLGTGVAAALAIAVGSAGGPVTNGGALGTPLTGNAANLTGLPVSTGVSGLGANVATFLGTPSGANLAGALSTALPDTKGGTGLTALGSGIAAFLGTPSGTNLATALTTKSGDGLPVFDTSPVLTTPTIGVATATRIATGTTLGNTTTFTGYDTNDAVVRIFATMTAGLVPDLTLSAPAGATLVLQPSTYKSPAGTTGTSDDIVIGIVTCHFSGGIFTGCS